MIFFIAGKTRNKDNILRICDIFEDKTYKVFIQNMRDLLKKADEFKNRYCEVNHITSREHKVKDEQGEITYIKLLKKVNKKTRKSSLFVKICYNKKE